MNATLTVLSNAELTAPTSSLSVSLVDWLHSRPTLSVMVGSLAILALLVATPVLALVDMVQSLSRFGRQPALQSTRASACPLWRFPGF